MVVELDFACLIDFNLCVTWFFTYFISFVHFGNFFLLIKYMVA